MLAFPAEVDVIGYSSCYWSSNHFWDDKIHICNVSASATNVYNCVHVNVIICDMQLRVAHVTCCS